LADVCLIVMTGLAFADALWYVPQTPEMRREATADRFFVSQVEQRLGGNGMVLQLPYTTLPGASGPGSMAEYDHARAYIQSTTKVKWSWGILHGTEMARWTQMVSDLPAAGMLSVILARGFTGIWIDTAGYSDSAKSLSAAMSAATNRVPLASSNGRYLFFDLTGLSVRPVTRASADQNLNSDHSAPCACNVDILNELALGAGPVEVDRSDMLRVAGWIANSQTLTAFDDVVVEISSADGRRYSVHAGRTDRLDVAKAFGSPALLHSGFTAFASLGDISPGSYQLRILQTRAGSVEACNTVVKLTIK
jgi:hypothetical protein